MLADALLIGSICAWWILALVLLGRILDGKAFR